MVAGLRGSSSGMPASTLPTRSAPDVGALGEDAAAETREDRDQRRAETERHQGVDGFSAVDRQAHRPGQDVVIARDAEQREPGHQHAGHGASLERDVEAPGQRTRRGLGGAQIGPHRHVHADEPRRARQHGADQEPDRDRPAEQQPKADEDHYPDDADGDVLAAQISLRALGDGAGDLLHALRAGIGRQDLIDGHGPIGDRQQPGKDN